MQGASTEIARWRETAAGWNTAEYELSGSQFALITDASDLFMEFTADPLAALNLDFTTGALDSKVTFTRTTQATVIGSNGLVRNAPHNALIYSTDFTNVTIGAWLYGAGTSVVHDATGPDGVANSAASVTLSTAGPGLYWWHVHREIGNRYVFDLAAGEVGYAAGCFVHIDEHAHHTDIEHDLDALSDRRTLGAIPRHSCRLPNAVV